MSDHEFDSLPHRFLLNGEEELSSNYDAEADVLYLWRGEKSRPAVSLETEDGHLLRFDLNTYELVGVTIFEWRTKWEPRGRLDLHVPEIQESEKARSKSRDFSVERMPTAV